MSEWISVNAELPKTKQNVWSDPVIALTDKDDVYKLSYFDGVDGGCWQRTKDFVSSGANSVTHWMPLPDAPK